ncbi:hypothetical protein [Ruminococcus albus]|uniref:Uncharacterized protein n=1 Tax=Ruminococcus albus TaxID=1264 RepID=A0A1I1NX37_RUMAL|nr:hypothetical protein [Ruminococcus albus]SFD02025.1 hypothetical protein SAMN02910406_02899 [Ruminococcus albus]
MYLNKNDVIRDLILGAELAVLYVSAIFLETIINDTCGFGVTIIYLLGVAALYGFTLLSKNKIEWFLKWGVSILFSPLVLLYFWETNYAIRALNWVIPGYGRESAGGGFVRAFLLIILSVLCIVGGIYSLTVNTKYYDVLKKVQLIVSSFFTVVIIVAVLVLETEFPSYERIMIRMSM